MPNDEDIVIWSGGKINKININSLNISEIPFQASANIKITRAVEFETPVSVDNFDAKVIRHALSPNEKSIVFNALEHLYSMSLPNGKPKRLTTSNDFEFQPSFSPDENSIIYVTWNDENLGAIDWISTFGGSSSKLTTQKGIYRNPSYSHDGKHIVYRKEGGNNEQGRTHSKNIGLYIMKADGSTTKHISKEGEYAIFSKDNKRIVYQKGGQFFGALTKN